MIGEGAENSRSYDIAIVGGGINGVGIARDAAGRGLKVLLVEQHDLASHTSSASTKLIHGGLRYLERYDFHLVRESLAERERLLFAAPHIISPLRFVLPHDPAIRSALLVRAGLFLYDRLAPRRVLAKSHGVDLSRSPLGHALRRSFDKGFVYSDCRVDDSRLVVLVALDAAERGAEILTRTKAIAAERRPGLWSLMLRPDGSSGTCSICTKVLVNAAGPWVNEVLEGPLGGKPRREVRLVKGSHMVVPALYTGDHAFILQNADRRIAFAIPYERRFTLIGTTDIAYAGDPAEVSASAAELNYLSGSLARYMRTPVRPGDAVWTFAGVRPLLDDGSKDPSAITRDYIFDVDAPRREAPVLSIFGGKITTFRRLAEQAVEALRPYFPGMRPSWTERATLPGGDIEKADFGAFCVEVRKRWPFLAPETTLRLAQAYGTRTERILGRARSVSDLGRDFGCGLTEAELDYLVRDEWARTAGDVLWRRSKLGLHLSKSEAEALVV